MSVNPNMRKGPQRMNKVSNPALRDDLVLPSARQPQVKEVPMQIRDQLIPSQSAHAHGFHQLKPPTAGQPATLDILHVGGFHKIEQAALMIASGMAAQALAIDDKQGIDEQEFAGLAIRLAKAVIDGCAPLCWGKPAMPSQGPPDAQASPGDDGPNYGGGFG